MQTLWARAAQVRSTCRCSLCSSPAAGLTKRVTGVPAWRRVTQGDVFLVFSSTLVFEAAVYDSVRKDARSKQWEKILAEGREKIDATEADQKRRIQLLLDSAEQRAADDGIQYEKPLKRHFEREGRHDWTWQGLFSWSSRVDELRRIEGFEGWKGPPLSLLKQLTADELQELQTDKRILRYFYGGPDCANLDPVPYTSGISTQKLRTLEWSMAKLVLKIVWAFCGESVYENLTRRPTSSQRRTAPLADTPLPGWPDLVSEAQDKLDQLYSHTADSNIYDDFEQPPMPRYDDPIDIYDEGRMDLNESLHEVLEEMKDKDNMSSQLADLCRRLLLSRTPPNVHAYNLLLVRFCQLEEISLVHFVLEAMWESHIRPNEITHATVLRFFTVTGNKADFALYVKRMRGLKGGLALADPDKPLSPLLRTRVHIFGETMQKVAEKARMNHEVYCALIVGVLRFFDYKDAMYWYRAMIDQGWRPTAELLTAILRECCLRSNWEAGVAVWQQFVEEALGKTTSAYEWMLRLCQRCEQNHMFHDILDDAVQEGRLPASILDHADEFQSRDADLVIADAKSNSTPTINNDMVRSCLRWQFQRLQRFHAEEGRVYLIENSLSGATLSKVELNIKIADWNRDYGILVRLKAAVAKHNTALSELCDDIALTISEIGNHLPMVRLPEPTLKLGLSGSLSSIPLDSSPKHLLTLYDEYRKRSASQLEQVAALESVSHYDAGFYSNIIE